MVVSGRNGSTVDPKIGGYTFQAVNYSKRLDAKINKSNSTHNEIVLIIWTSIQQKIFGIDETI